MRDRRIVLLRGINVGKAKRVAMADLRRWLEELGYERVRTLLNSGNVVLDVPAGAPEPGPALEEAIAREAGFATRVVAITEAELGAIVRDNPLEVHDPTQFLVGVLADPSDAAELAPFLAGGWAPDALAVVGRAVYQRCSSGILDSPLAAAVAKALGDGVTARNWATLGKIAALAAT